MDTGKGKIFLYQRKGVNPLPNIKVKRPEVKTQNCDV